MSRDLDLLDPAIFDTQMNFPWPSQDVKTTMFNAAHYNQKLTVHQNQTKIFLENKILEFDLLLDEYLSQKAKYNDIVISMTNLFFIGSDKNKCNN